MGSDAADGLEEMRVLDEPHAGVGAAGESHEISCGLVGGGAALIERRGNEELVGLAPLERAPHILHPDYGQAAATELIHEALDAFGVGARVPAAEALLCFGQDLESA